jgi:predicted metalloprotease with PDZ domain
MPTSSSTDITADLEKCMRAQKKFLGGVNSNKKYTVLLYLSEMKKTDAKGFGALEHNSSTTVVFPEMMPTGALGKQIIDVVSHEFFHIVTPLGVHSNEIHYFDFIDPKMSEHLWLYEGVTEYSAQHVQAKQGLVSAEHFLDEMSKKMTSAEMFNNNISFTEMSKTCLDKNKRQYSNVYLKGALIGMAVDLKLRTLSGGKYGIQNLMVDLSKKYGIEKPFKDNELFDEMANLSGFPQIKDFMQKHVGGTAELPIKELMKEAGIDYSDNGFIEELSIFGFNPQRGITFDMENQKLKLLGDGIDDFGKELGFRDSDLVKSWNGEELSLSNVQQVLTSYAMSAAEGADLKVTVLREKEIPAKEKKKREKAIKKGKKVEELPMTEVNLSGKLKKVRTPQKHAFNIDDQAGEQELLIRKSWLGEYKRESEMKK